MGVTNSILSDVKTEETNRIILDDVKKIIEPYLIKPQVQRSMISVPFLGNIQLRLDHYVYLMRSAIFTSHRTHVPFMSSLYNFAEIDTRRNFTGRIDILNYDDRNIDGRNPEREPIFISPQGTHFRYIHIKDGEEYKYIDMSDVKRMDIGPNTDIYRLFIREIITQYRNPECKFISILLSLSNTRIVGHANMFLILKDSPNSVKFIIYEPHGSWGTLISTMTEYTFPTGSALEYINMKKSFLDLMKRIFRQIGVATSVENTSFISCPKGIQRSMKDSVGYCQTISLFWLYIFLRLINNYDEDNKKKLLADLSQIERSVYTLTKNKPDKLYSLVINFTYDFLSSFYNSYLKPDISNIDPQPVEVDEAYYEYAKKYSPTTVTKTDVGRYYSTHPNSGDTDYKDFITAFAYFYDSIHIRKKFTGVQSTDKPRIRRKKPIPVEDESRHVRNRAGGPCNNDNECYSNLCYENKCVPDEDEPDYSDPKYRQDREDREDREDQEHSEDSDDGESRPNPNTAKRRKPMLLGD
jgi:hypothetical protein